MPCTLATGELGYKSLPSYSVADRKSARVTPRGGMESGPAGSENLGLRVHPAGCGESIGIVDGGRLLLSGCCDDVTIRGAT